jgi:cytochrome c biogenesis protein
MTTTELADDATEVQALSTQPAPVRLFAGRRRSPLTAARQGWRRLTSMRTALVLLFLLALAAVPGSLLPQRGLNPLQVNGFYRAHPTLAPVLDRLSMFDVFAAPWFGAIYLLLFVSLAGCLVPRLRLHARALRGRPPHAPRQLTRLPSADSWDARADPAAVAAAAARLLRARRFRVDVRREDGGAVSVSAEKGYLRETGNLLFHVALLALLVGIGMGGLFGYKGTVLVQEGDGFANTVTSYDTLRPGRLFSPAALAPFTFELVRFHATYQPNGSPRTFVADVRYAARPGQPMRPATVRVNAPLQVHGAKVYLLGHGYAPHFRVVDAAGRLALDGAVPFLPQDANFTSTGVVKVPDVAAGKNAKPQQLGFAGFFTPSTVLTRDGLASDFPDTRNPVVTLNAWRGDLGLDSGVPQSVYRLETAGLTQLRDANGGVLARALRPGQTWALPGGGSLTFTGVEQWATFQVTHDPGNRTALAASVAIVVGLLLSLRVRRRRVWLRATPAADAAGGRRTVVAAGGLARTDADAFAEEFAEIAGRLRPAPPGPPTEED